MDKIPCSVGILTFNSGPSLGLCLESVKEFSDIVICDGGSTDNTLAIAAEYSCRIINQDKSFKNPDNTIADFSGVRNQQLAAAKYDWFMFLDSDEYVSSELVEEIRGVVLKGLSQPMIFDVPRKYVREGHVIDCATTYPNYQTRFFNKKAVTEFVRTVHEKIQPKDGYTIAKLKKYEYVPLDDVQSMKKKWATYLAIEEQRGGREGFSTWFMSGLLYHSAVSLLYCLRYIKNLFFCKGNKMPLSYEVLRLWYNFEVIKIGFRRVRNNPPKQDREISQESNDKNMKLYYVANARMPHKKAYAIQIAKMCEAFVEEGVDLELIIPKQKDVVSNIRDYYKLSTPLNVVSLPVLDFYASGQWGFFLSSLSFMVSYSFYLVSKILQGKRGIIYTTDMDTFSFVPLVFFGMPCFLETHGGKAKTWRSKIFFNRTKGVITINNIIKKQIADNLTFAEDKMLVWPNGIDLELFCSVQRDEARRRLSLPKDSKIIMYCGRFYGWKGLEVLVRAVKDLPSGISVYIVGGTKEEFMSVAQKTKLSENFVFPGEKPYTEIPIWLSAADALLVLGTRHDTQSYYYTSPMKVFEYLAMGRQIIASNTPAIQDIVSEKEVIFYEPDDSRDLTKKMIIAVSGSPALGEKILTATTRAKDFTWQKRAKDIIAFMNNNI